MAVRLLSGYKCAVTMCGVRNNHLDVTTRLCCQFSWFSANIFARKGQNRSQIHGNRVYYAKIFAFTRKSDVVEVERVLGFMCDV